ncbi:MAG: hypothetical protein H7329_03375 [Opitutaceae bacterium]|nr:hypothetical protein [Cytophagales bacterium]
MKYFFLIILSVLFIFKGISQPISKIYPENKNGILSSPKNWSGSKNLAADNNTLIVGDGNSSLKHNNNCLDNVGNVTVYKKDKYSNWMVHQILFSTNYHSNFGLNVAFSGNYLAVTSNNEISNDSVIAGAIYFYKRNHPDSLFKLIDKVFAKNQYGTDSINFQALALNSNYLCSSLSNSNQLRIYKIDSYQPLSLKYSPALFYESPSELFITDSSQLVGFSNDGILDVNLNKNPTFDLYFVGGYFRAVSLYASGSTKIYEGYGSRPGYYYYSFTNDDGSYDRLEGLELQEKSSILGSGYTLKSQKWFVRRNGNQLQIFKFKNSIYSYVGTLSPPENSTNLYPGNIALNDNSLFVTDRGDSTNIGSDLCIGTNGKGVIYEFNLKNLSIITSNKNENSEPFQTLISPNPTSGNEIFFNNVIDEVELIGIIGSYSKEIVVGDQKCNISDVPRGVYMVRYKQGSLRKIERFIRE